MASISQSIKTKTTINRPVSEIASVILRAIEMLSSSPNHSAALDVAGDLAGIANDMKAKK